jgi:signal transduction histidine kinase
MTGSEWRGQGGDGAVLSTFWTEGRPLVVKIHRISEGRVLAVLSVTERLLVGTEAPGFEATVTTEAPARAPPRSGLLFLAGYLAFRDVVRELPAASLRSSFVSSVTHELKTPLTSFQLLAENHRRSLVPRSAGKLRDAIFLYERIIAESPVCPPSDVPSRRLSPRS